MHSLVMEGQKVLASKGQTTAIAIGMGSSSAQRERIKVGSLRGPALEIVSCVPSERFLSTKTMQGDVSAESVCGGGARNPVLSSNARPVVHITGHDLGSPQGPDHGGTRSATGPWFRTKITAARHRRALDGVLKRRLVHWSSSRSLIWITLPWPLYSTRRVDKDASLRLPVSGGSPEASFTVSRQAIGGGSVLTLEANND